MEAGELALMDHGWKQYERRVSRDHGVERQAVTGARDASDAMPHPMFCLQIKLRRSIPKVVREWSDSIVRAARAEGKIGVLIMKEPHARDDAGLVVLQYRDWIDLHGQQHTE